MRRFFLAFALTLIAAASVTAVAFAKEGGVELSSTPPGGIGPGDPWTPRLTLIDEQGRLPANAEPGITITNLETGRTIDYAATPTKDPAVYTVRVVFPTPGQWDYAAYDGVTDRLYEFPATTVVAPKGALTATPKPASTSSEGSFPVWPLVGGIGGAALLGLAGLLVIRNRRFAH
jgi:MYXO-CTERM domain-containing protein